MRKSKSGASLAEMLDLRALSGSGLTTREEEVGAANLCLRTHHVKEIRSLSRVRFVQRGEFLSEDTLGRLSDGVIFGCVIIRCPVTPTQVRCNPLDSTFAEDGASLSV